MGEKKNVILNLNPLTQIEMVVLLAFIALLFDYRISTVVLCVMIGMACAAGILKPFLSMWMKTIVFITVVVFIMQLFFLPGETEIWSFWIFSIKQESLSNAISVCTRLLGVGTAAVLGIQMVNVDKLVIVLEEKGLSASATYVLLSTVNIIPQMSKKMKVIMDAQKSRGIETESNIWVRAKAFFPTIGPLILNSIVNAEERTITLEARGFTAPVKKTRLHSIEDSGADKILRKIFLLIFIIVIIGRVVLWIV